MCDATYVIVFECLDFSHFRADQLSRLLDVRAFDGSRMGRANLATLLGSIRGLESQIDALEASMRKTVDCTVGSLAPPNDLWTALLADAQKARLRLIAAAGCIRKKRRLLITSPENHLRVEKMVGVAEERPRGLPMGTWRPVRLPIPERERIVKPLEAECVLRNNLFPEMKSVTVSIVGDDGSPESRNALEGLLTQRTGIGFWVSAPGFVAPSITLAFARNRRYFLSGCAVRSGFEGASVQPSMLAWTVEGLVRR
jgi:hypothetical protein